MKSTYALGILLILSASACAPVASSGPKFAQSATPQIHDSVVKSAPEQKRENKSASNVRVVSVDEYEAFEKSIDADYILQRFDEKDAQVAEFRHQRTMKNIDLGKDTVDFLVIFIVKTKPTRTSKLRLESHHDSRKSFSFLVPPTDKEMDAVWADIQSNLISIVVASREAYML